jgi:hypothetical protein
MLKFNLVPKVCCILGHKQEVDMRWRYETIDTSIPCNLTTSFTYILTNLSTEFVIFICKKKPILSQSVDYHPNDITAFFLSKLDTKSIVMLYF